MTISFTVSFAKRNSRSLHVFTSKAFMLLGGLGNIFLLLLYTAWCMFIKSVGSELDSEAILTNSVPISFVGFCVNHRVFYGAHKLTLPAQACIYYKQAHKKLYRWVNTESRLNRWVCFELSRWHGNEFICAQLMISHRFINVRLKKMIIIL